MPDVILRGAWNVGDRLGGDWTGEKLDKAHRARLSVGDTFGGDLDNLYDKAGVCDANISSFRGNFTATKDVAASSSIIAGVRFGGDFRSGISKVFSASFVADGLRGRFSPTQDKADDSAIGIAPVTGVVSMSADRYAALNIVNEQYFSGDWHPLMRSVLPIPPIGNLTILGFVGEEDLQGAFLQAGVTKVLQLEIVGQHLDLLSDPKWNTHIHFFASTSSINLDQFPIIHKSTAPTPGGISITGIDTNYATSNGTVHQLTAQIPLSPKDLSVDQTMVVFFDAFIEIKGMDERYSLLPGGPGSFTLLAGTNNTVRR